jgi:hypothetical protein
MRTSSPEGMAEIARLHRVSTKIEILPEQIEETQREKKNLCFLCLLLLNSGAGASVGFGVVKFAFPRTRTS